MFRPSRDQTGPRLRAAVALGLCIALSLSVACARNPVSGRPEVVLMSTDREIALGTEAAEQVATHFGLVEDERLIRYVQEVGKRVAAHSPRQDVTYRFFVVDMEEPNAFALPGGFVYVSRGLVAFSNDEDELANVLGHEIAHVAARHAAQRQTRGVGVGLVLLPAALVGALLGAVIGTPGDVASAAVNAPLQMLGGGFIAAYSRDQEREADDVGQAMAAEAGYDPAGLTHFMHTLEAYEELRTGEVRSPGFFDSHPTTPERATNTRKNAAQLTWTAQPHIAVGRSAFLDRIEGILVGGNPAEGVFQEQRFLHPDLDFTIVFPEEWELINARAGVGGFSPDKDAQVVLELQGEGDDPKAAANEAIEEFSKQITIRIVESGELRIHGHRAFRANFVAARGRNTLPVTMTWVAKGGMVYRFAGTAKTDVFADLRSTLEAVPDSFRKLTPGERASIREGRLRVAKVRSGESLSGVNERTGNAWDVKETAVANSLEAEASLQAGQLLKVSVPQPYKPKPPG